MIEDLAAGSRIARLQAQAIGLGGEITYLSPEEGAKANQVNFAVLDRVWNLWTQKVAPAK